MLCQEVDLPCATIDCDPSSESCPQPECEGSEHVCVPAPCASDADCGGELVCLEVSYDICSPVAVPPPCDPAFEECDSGSGPDEEPVDPECETHTEAYCAPRWAGPCAEAADCGEGFACVEAEMCWCSGSAGSGGGDSGGGDDPAPPEGDDEPLPSDEDCGCEGTGEFYCEPLEVECETADVCPEGWTCEAMTVAVACTYDAETGEEICEEPPESDAGRCMPPYWGFGWAADDAGARDALEYATGSEDAHATGPADERADGEQGLGAIDGPQAGGGVGCSAVPGADRAGLALAWLLPLLVLGLRRGR